MYDLINLNKYYNNYFIIIVKQKNNEEILSFNHIDIGFNGLYNIKV